MSEKSVLDEIEEFERKQKERPAPEAESSPVKDVTDTAQDDALRASGVVASPLYSAERAEKVRRKRKPRAAVPIPARPLEEPESDAWEDDPEKEAETEEDSDAW